MLTGCVSDVASVSDTGQTGRGRKPAGGGAGERLDNFSGEASLWKLLLSGGI